MEWTKNLLKSEALTVEELREIQRAIQYCRDNKPDLDQAAMKQLTILTQKVLYD